jgi:hypothetical protein
VFVLKTKTDADIYAEKTIATYETQYRDNPMAKPQEITLTITNKHLFGKAFVCEQIATMEEDIFYSRFTANIADITKISINSYIKELPIYISFERPNKKNKNAKDRKRIVLPGFDHPENIVAQITETKEKLLNFSKTLTEKGEDSEAQIKNDKKADEAFERMSKDYVAGHTPEPVANTEALMRGAEKIKSSDEVRYDNKSDAPKIDKAKIAETAESSKTPATSEASTPAETPANPEASSPAETPVTPEAPVSGKAIETPADNIFDMIDELLDSSISTNNSDTTDAEAFAEPSETDDSIELPEINSLIDSIFTSKKPKQDVTGTETASTEVKKPVPEKKPPVAPAPPHELKEAVKAVDEPDTKAVEKKSVSEDIEKTSEKISSKTGKNAEITAPTAEPMGETADSTREETIANTYVQDFTYLADKSASETIAAQTVEETVVDAVEAVETVEAVAVETPKAEIPATKPTPKAPIEEKPAPKTPVAEKTVEKAPVAEKPVEKAPVPEKPQEKTVTETEPGEKMTLEEFEKAVKKLKILFETGVITDEEYNNEKTRILTTLY